MIQGSFAAGLDWLAAEQDEGGTWGDPATTGIALLSFVGAGETPRFGTHREVVMRAWKALADGQDADGCLVSSASPRRLRDHAITALALVEVFGLTGSRAFAAPAERAVAFASKTRSPGGAWNLAAPDEDEIDVETTVWMSLLLLSAAQCELPVDAAAKDEIVAALDRVTDPATGRVHVSVRAPMPFSDAAATAAGLVVRTRWGGRDRDDPIVAKAADVIVSSMPRTDTTDLPAVYFGTLAMLSVGGDRLRGWLPALVAFLPRGRDDDGSWAPAGGETTERARVWATAYHLLLCEKFHGPVGHALMRR